MEYDKTHMPATYDAARGYSPDVMARWMNLLSRHVPKAAVRDIVDLGCGTGRFSMALAEHFEADLIGVDPSEKMLAQARGKPTRERVSFRSGAGEALPLEDTSADVVFISNVFHHFKDPAAVARECRRVLRPRGVLFLRNSMREHVHTFPNKDIFPGIDEVLARELPSRPQITAVFEGAALTLSEAEVVLHEMAPSWAALALRVAHRADSILVQLSDEKFQAGMMRLRRRAETADPNEAIFINVDLLVFRPG